MGVYQHLEEYAGLPVFRFAESGPAGPADGGPAGPAGSDGEELPPAAAAAWYVGAMFDEEPFGEMFARFLGWTPPRSARWSSATGARPTTRTPPTPSRC